jgi:hypothetical protein
MVIVLPFPVTTGLHAPFVWTDAGVLCVAATPQNRRRNAMVFMAPSYHLSLSVVRLFGESEQSPLTVAPFPVTIGLQGPSVF